MGLAEMESAKISFVGKRKFFYNSYLPHQFKFPMLPLFETNFNLTIFSSLNLVSFYLFYYL